jgi:peroxiredoxin
MAPKLGSGDVFPRLKLQLTDGRTLELPDGLGGKYNIVLFYRGHW